jgi:hypothetical protein
MQGFLDLVAIIAFSIPAEVFWNLAGTVITVKLNIETVHWAMIGTWVCPFPVALLYLRLSGKTWLVSLLLGGILGICVSAGFFVLLWMAIAGMA